MELVILSAVAVAAILIAELLALAGREHLDPAVTPQAPRLTTISGNGPIDRTANQDSSTTNSEYDRAA